MVRRESGDEGIERRGEGKVESIKAIKMEKGDKTRGGEERLGGGQVEGIRR